MKLGNLYILIVLACINYFVGCASSPNPKEIVLSPSEKYAEEGVNLAMISGGSESSREYEIQVTSVPSSIKSYDAFDDESILNIPIEAMLNIALAEVISRKPNIPLEYNDSSITAKTHRISHDSFPRPLSWVPHFNVSIVFEIKNNNAKDTRYWCKKKVTGKNYKIALYDLYPISVEGYSITFFTALAECLDETFK